MSIQLLVGNLMLLAFLVLMVLVVGSGINRGEDHD